MSEDENMTSSHFLRTFSLVFFFCQFPINETIDFICDEVYIHKKLQPICKRSIFKRILLKLTTECTFSINEQLCKQIEFPWEVNCLWFYQIAS